MCSIFLYFFSEAAIHGSSSIENIMFLKAGYKLMKGILGFCTTKSQPTPTFSAQTRCSMAWLEDMIVHFKICQLIKQFLSQGRLMAWPCVIKVINNKELKGNHDDLV